MRQHLDLSHGGCQDRIPRRDVSAGDSGAAKELVTRSGSGDVFWNQTKKLSNRSYIVGLPA